MQVSLNWLKEYVDIDVGVEELCEKLTMLGLEIEAVKKPGEEVKDVVVGEILSIEAHPDADKLVVCKTAVGAGEPLQIICGASNMVVGDKVPTARIGSVLPGGFKIGKRKMRGLDSQGMMCSARELEIGDDHGGLLILDRDARVGEDILAMLGLDDTILEIEVTPNRNDWSSMVGVARELAAAYGTALRLPDVSVREGTLKTSGMSSVTIEDSDLCPRYVARVVTGVKIGPSPAWLARRLIAAGMRPINNVVDATNYVMLEMGQPLHAFDFEKLEGRRIVVRRARKGETLKVIDQSVQPLKDGMLVIADAKNPVAVAGVMGGFDSEVGEGTTEILVESAYFNPSSIRKTARSLNMLTESAQRFQRGADAEVTLDAANRACRLILELAGGELAAGALDEYPAPVPRKQVTLRYARSNDLLGVEVSSDRQRAILDSLGFSITSENGDSLSVEVPPRRHDVSHESDLIEEIARLHGYAQIQGTLPEIRPADRVFTPGQALLRGLREHLARAGLTEVVNWTFSSVEYHAKARLEERFLTMVPIANPLSENHGSMRTSLIPGLLHTASSNLRKNRKNVAIFELSAVYAPGAKKELPSQAMRVAVVLAGASSEKHWSRAQHGADLYDLKGIVEGICEYFGVEAGFESAEFDCFASHESGRILSKKRELGRLGLVHGEVLDAFDIDQPLYLAELDLEPLLAASRPPAQFATIPAHPPSLRDMAVVVDESVPAGEIRASVQRGGGKLLKEVRLFDIYTGKQVGPGKKSVALNLVFQSGDRTLTDKDTQKAWDKILRKLRQEFGAELR